MKKIIIVLCVVSLTIVLSCKKDSGPSVTDLLTANTWKAVSFNEGGGPLTSWCTLNSTDKYRPNGTGVYTQGDNHGACSGAAIGDTFPFTWRLIDNDKKIVYTGVNYPGYDDTAEIKELNSVSLKLNYLITDRDPDENWLEGFIPN
jgi:hypothetical protein